MFKKSTLETYITCLSKIFQVIIISAHVFICCSNKLIVNVLNSVWKQISYIENKLNKIFSRTVSFWQLFCYANTAKMRIFVTSP